MCETGKDERVMDWTWFHQLGQLEFWEGLLTGFEDLGPLVPILLAAVESFFPPLPPATPGRLLPCRSRAIP